MKFSDKHPYQHVTARKLTTVEHEAPPRNLLYLEKYQISRTHREAIAANATRHLHQCHVNCHLFELSSSCSDNQTFIPFDLVDQSQQLLSQLCQITKCRRKEENHHSQT